MWASSCGKCSPNLLLQLLVEGCQPLLPGARAAQGHGCPRQQPCLHQIPAAFCWGTQLAPFVETLQGFEGFGAACGEEAQTLQGFWGHLSFGQRQNSGWISSSSCSSRLLVLPVVQKGLGFPFPGRAVFPFPSPAASPCPPWIPTPAGRCPEPLASLPAGLRSFDVFPASCPEPRGTREAGAHRAPGKAAARPRARPHGLAATTGLLPAEAAARSSQRAPVFWVSSSPSAVL